MSFIFLRNRVTGGAAFTPASLFSSGEQGAWYEPSTTTCFTDTAGTTAASVGDKVARINDLSGNGNHATQTNPDPRPLLQQTAGGLYYLDFDGSDDGMTVGTTSTFNFVHNGAGAEILAAVTPSDVANPNAFYAFLSNNDGGAANIGFTIGFDDRASQSRNEALFLQVARGVSNSPTFVAVTTDTITNFTSPTVFRFGYKEAESPEYFFNENQVSVYSGNSTNAPSASDATSALSIGIFSNGTQNWNGKFFGLIMIDRFLTTGEASDTETYLAAKSGVTL